MIPQNTDLLITHGPVLGIQDIVINGKHVGCRDLLEKVKATKPKVHVCGHIHEGYGSTQKYGVKFMNASVLNETYELVNKPMVFTL
jgi:Icc-related predicted phosphoesterase